MRLHLYELDTRHYIPSRQKLLCKKPSVVSNHDQLYNIILALRVHLIYCVVIIVMLTNHINP